MNKNPFLSRLMKDKTENVIHSSAYAKAQNTGIGSSSTESFAKRREIDQNRTVVQGYEDSKIINDAQKNKPKATTYDTTKDSFTHPEKSNNKNNFEQKAIDRAKYSSRDFANNNFNPNSNSTQSRVQNTTDRFAPRANNITPPPRRNPGIFR